MDRKRNGNGHRLSKEGEIRKEGGEDQGTKYLSDRTAHLKGSLLTNTVLKHSRYSSLQPSHISQKRFSEGNDLGRI